jgi:hypothetical protein
MTAVPRRRTQLLVLILFAVAMGWLESVLVVYIRTILGLAHTGTYPSSVQTMRRLAEFPWLIPTEQTREVATLVMLAAVAWLSAPRTRARFGAFLIGFGVWDITYYAGLYALVRWPPSLGTMDLLFLIPPGRGRTGALPQTRLRARGTLSAERVSILSSIEFRPVLRF